MTSKEPTIGHGGSGPAPASAGKYLTFGLGDEVYGLDILRVLEIIGLVPITRVPKTPRFVRGVINLRGRVVPVIDLRMQFGLKGVEESRETCIIVVQIKMHDTSVTTGILVDRVSEVIHLDADRIEPPPSFGTTLATEFITGIGKTGSDLVILLDVDRVFSSLELAFVGEVQQKTEKAPGTKNEMETSGKETSTCSGK